MDKELNLIDIRSEYRFIQGHIPNAVNIPSNRLMLNPKYYLTKDKTYYIYCQNGTTSMSVVSTLNNLGYKTINLEGGYNTYLKNI